MSLEFSTIIIKQVKRLVVTCLCSYITGWCLNCGSLCCLYTLSAGIELLYISSILPQYRNRTAIHLFNPTSVQESNCYTSLQSYLSTGIELLYISSILPQYRNRTAIHLFNPTSVQESNCYTSLQSYLSTKIELLYISSIPPQYRYRFAILVINTVSVQDFYTSLYRN